MLSSEYKFFPFFVSPEHLIPWLNCVCVISTLEVLYNTYEHDHMSTLSSSSEIRALQCRHHAGAQWDAGRWYMKGLAAPDSFLELFPASDW